MSACRNSKGRFAKCGNAGRAARGCETLRSWSLADLRQQARWGRFSDAPGARDAHLAACAELARRGKKSSDCPASGDRGDLKWASRGRAALKWNVFTPKLALGTDEDLWRIYKDKRHPMLPFTLYHMSKFMGYYGTLKAAKVEAEAAEARWTGRRDRGRILIAKTVKR